MPTYFSALMVTRTNDSAEGALVWFHCKNNKVCPLASHCCAEGTIRVIVIGLRLYSLVWLTHDPIMGIINTILRHTWSQISYIPWSWERTIPLSLVFNYNQVTGCVHSTFIQSFLRSTSSIQLIVCMQVYALKFYQTRMKTSQEDVV